jgi:hypothetical protein
LRSSACAGRASGGLEQEPLGEPEIDDRMRALFQDEVEAEELPRRDATALRVERGLHALDQTLAGDPFALDDRRLAHECLVRARVQVDAHEELGLRHGARLGEANAAAADHATAVAATLAATSEAVGKGREERAEQRLVARELAARRVAQVLASE